MLGCRSNSLSRRTVRDLLKMYQANCHLPRSTAPDTRGTPMSRRVIIYSVASGNKAAEGLCANGEGCCFRRVCFVAGLAGGLSIVALFGSAASASSSGDAPGRVQSAHGAAAIASGGAWRTAEEVPGTGVLNAGGMAIAGQVSCAVAGNC